MFRITWRWVPLSCLNLILAIPCQGLRNSMTDEHRVLFCISCNRQSIKLADETSRIYQSDCYTFITRESFNDLWCLHCCDDIWMPDTIFFMTYLSFILKHKSPSIHVLKPLTLWIICFLQVLFSKDSFIKTSAAKEYMIAGWEPKVNAWSLLTRILWSHLYLELDTCESCVATVSSSTATSTCCLCRKKLLWYIFEAVEGEKYAAHADLSLVS